MNLTGSEVPILGYNVLGPELTLMVISKYPILDFKAGRSRSSPPPWSELALWWGLGPALLVSGSKRGYTDYHHEFHKKVTGFPREYSWLLNNVGVRGADPPPTVENLHITLKWALCICGSASMDSTNLRSCSSVVFTTEKNPHISGPTQFKSVLVKGQL